MLYSKPFAFLQSFNAPESPEEFELERESTDISYRIQLLLSTLVGADFRHRQEGRANYIDYIRQLDFLLMDPLRNEFAPARGSYKRDKIHHLFEPLLLSAGLQYHRLRHLEIHFDKNQSAILTSKNVLDIAQCCQNLRVFRVRAKNTFNDADLATLLQRQQPNTFQELLIERSLEMSFENSLRALRAQHHSSFVKISLEITNCHRLSNDGLAVPARSFSALRHLIIRETAITSSKVINLCESSGVALQTLNLSVDVRLQPELVSTLVSHCPSLKNVAFSFLSYNLVDLEILANGCNRLQKLKLGHPQENDLHQIESTLCRVISSCEGLEYLDIGHTPATPLVISQLSGKSTLHELKIDFAFQTNIFWTQVAVCLGERFAWCVDRDDLNTIIYRRKA
ncbi:hypothetical protein K493DRAFT_403687 [Basidiobolus meristosporus CBS 931.73]|uniref:RNI-like protein n=1 Tax=Basidiobolus meristosporus CBS 931.73 TaxID=1314790 RepID=A0A1Y1ZB03_9FUNG|nr:hypothetical protein K493DRAFT_403687 [Basidiobolus meristosporus CBS 931.73]|eukprot:ORY07448.1 hypothetical protein K493DRAFT_403687 [Basidiobolus meristosporus CBS 931.73]